MVCPLMSGKGADSLQIDSQEGGGEKKCGKKSNLIGGSRVRGEGKAEYNIVSSSKRGGDPVGLECGEKAALTTAGRKGRKKKRGKAYLPAAADESESTRGASPYGRPREKGERKDCRGEILPVVGEKNGDRGRKECLPRKLEW